MGVMDHWHPVYISSKLRNKPVGIKLNGRQIVLFRGAGGAVGALDDVCPHRRMRLSAGSVVDGKLQCRYHGWTYTTCGEGESPGTPKLHACAASYETREEYGAVWLKPHGVEAAFPKLPTEGLMPMGVLWHTVTCPLETTLDNFCEIEHTPTTHAVFGYDLHRMHEVTVRFESTDTTVRVINRGPQKKMPWFLRRLLGIRKYYVFNDDWTTFFSPIYCIYDHWWSDPTDTWEGKVRWKMIMFFYPLDDETTGIMSFPFAKSRHLPNNTGLPLFKSFMRKKLDYEVGLDVFILENLADKKADLEGMKLSRFDRALGLNRERIKRVYRGLAD